MKKYELLQYYENSGAYNVIYSMIQEFFTDNNDHIINASMQVLTKEECIEIVDKYIRYIIKELQNTISR
jgi:hypothetical protein